MSASSVLSLSVIVLLAFASLAAAQPVPIAANGGSLAGVTSTPVNYTYTITQNQIDTYVNFYFIVSINEGYWGPTNTSYENALVAVNLTSSNRNYNFANNSIINNGWLTNGQIMVNLDPRVNKVFLRTAATVTFTVHSAGTIGVPYNVSLYARTPLQVADALNEFGAIGRLNGKVITAQVPCCGARYQIPLLPYARTGYYLVGNATLLNNSAVQASIWGFGTAGVQSTQSFVDGTAQPALCDGQGPCSTVLQPYYFEIQTPRDSPEPAQFRVTFTFLPASNVPSFSGGNGGNGTTSSTGLNAAATRSPSTLLSAAVALAATVAIAFAQRP